MTRWCAGVLAALVLTIPARAADEPRAIVAKAIQATGGEEMLAKLKAGRLQMKGTVEVMGQSLEFSGKISRQHPGQVRSEIEFAVNGMNFNVVEVYNNGKAWRQFLDKTEEVGGDQLAEKKEEAHAARVGTLLPLLKDKDIKLDLIGEDKVNDQPAVGVKVQCKDFKDVDLWFDKKSGLLVKSVRPALDPNTMKESQRETILGGFKEVNGLQHPTKMTILQDGKKFLEIEITETKLLEKIDETEFGKP